jgi:hypothetical protein
MRENNPNRRLKRNEKEGRTLQNLAQTTQITIKTILLAFNLLEIINFHANQKQQQSKGYYK